jgi:hypothetical protein
LSCLSIVVPSVGLCARCWLDVILSRFLLCAHARDECRFSRNRDGAMRYIGGVCDEVNVIAYPSLLIHVDDNSWLSPAVL